MAKQDSLSEADGTSLSTSDRGQPVVTYVRVGRGMIKVTKYEKQDKAKRRQTDGSSIHSFDSSQPNTAPSIKSRASSGNARTMPGWMPKFKMSKKSKKAFATPPPLPTPHAPLDDPFSASGPSGRVSSQYAAHSSTPDIPRTVSPLPKDSYLAPPPLMPTPPSSPAPKQPRLLRATHSHGDLSSDPQTATPDMWASINQLESELVARYGRGAVPQFDALRLRAQAMANALQPERQEPSYNWPAEPSELPYVSEEPSQTSYPGARSADPAWYPEQPPAPRARTRTETLPAKKSKTAAYPTRPFVDDLGTHAHDGMRGTAEPKTKEPSPELLEQEDSDDGALAYLQALGLEPDTPPKNNVKRAPQSQPRPTPQPTRAATLPNSAPTQPQPMRYPMDRVSRLEQTRHNALVASIINPPSAALEQYAPRNAAPRPDYITTTQRAPSRGALGLVVDSPPRSSSPRPDTASLNEPPTSDMPTSKSQRRDLPPRPPPPSSFAPYAPANSIPPLNVSRSPKLMPPESPLTSTHGSPASFSRNSPLPRPQGSPMSLAPPPNVPRGGSSASQQLALPLVRVRITSPPHRGTLRALPALIMLSSGARTSFAAATWAQMVAYCARNAGVAIARRGGGGIMRVTVEERMAEIMTPGGGRGVGDEEVGFGLGYYVSVDMVLEGEGPVDEHHTESSVPVAVLSIELPTTMGEIATMFRERKDIRKALS